MRLVKRNYLLPSGTLAMQKGAAEKMNCIFNGKPDEEGGQPRKAAEGGK